MRLTFPLVLIEQIDLNVALVRAAPQVVLTHQTVEVDRRRGAGVDLVVGNFRYLTHVIGQRVEDAQRIFERRSFRHVHHDLELALVVEGQHLHDDRAYEDEAERHHDQAEDG